MVELSIDEALQKGIEAHRNGELQLADRYYTAIIKAQPDHPEANHNMGVLAVSLGKLEVGLPFLQTALKANPKKSLFWLSLLDTLLKLENYGEAKKVLKQAKASGVSGEKIDQFTELLEENNGKHEEADTPKVDAGPTPEQLKELTNLFHSGQLDDVVKLADKLLKTFPKSVSLLNILGAAFSGLKQYESAIKHYQHALELKPNSAEIYYNLGVAFCAVQKTSNAIESYETACKIKPDYAQAYNNLGVVLGSTGSTKKAISSYRKAIQADTNYAEAHNNLGIALSKTGQTEEAVECYKRAIELKPNYSEAYNNLSALLVELKDLDGAIKHYNHAIRIKPNYAEAHNNLGIALSKTGQTEGAIKNYERAIELKPNYAEAYNNLGTLQAELGNLSEAIFNHKTALKIKPDYAEVYNNLGIALSKTGETEEAIKSYERAIELKPDYAEAKHNMIELLKVYTPADVSKNQLVKLNQIIASRDQFLNLNKTNELLSQEILQTLDTIKNTDPNLRTILSQIYDRSSVNLNCSRHSAIFETQDIIPKFCFGCYKVQVEVSNIFDLLRLSHLFYLLKLEDARTKKCMIETRENIPGFFKGLIYCKGLHEAKSIKAKLDKKLTVFNQNLTAKIKHGCSEFPMKYPEYGKIETDDEMSYPPAWAEIEKKFDAENNLYSTHEITPSLKNFCLSDMLIIHKWIDYAKGLDDNTAVLFKDLDIVYNDVYELARKRKSNEQV